MFNADKTFMAGIFGITGMRNQNLSSLGFIVTNKIQKEYFHDLQWDDQITGDLIIQSKDKITETETFCNNSMEKLTQSIRYPTHEGA